MTLIQSKDLIGKKESILDTLLLLNPLTTPLINLVGFDKPVADTTVTFYEDEMFPTATTLTAAIDAVTKTIAVADTEAFLVDCVAEIGEESVYVTAVDESAGTITVERGYAGTTAAEAKKGDSIEFQFVVNEEGGETKQARFKAKTPVYNVTQIFKEGISVSGTTTSIAMHGQGDMEDVYLHERLKKETELAAQLERALINGRKIDNGKFRTMAGIRQMMKTNVIDAGGQPVTAAMITDVSKSLYEKGAFDAGANFVIMCGANQKVAISNLQADNVRITQQENQQGRVVDVLLNDFAQLPIVLNNNLKPDEVFLIDTNRIKIRPLVGREFHHVFEGVDGDRTKGFVVGEYTLEFNQESAQARIKNLA